MAFKKSNILIVEDESITTNLLQEILKAKGYQVSDVVPSAEMALDSMIKEKPDLVLMDIQLEGSMDVVETAEVIHREWNVPVIYITTHADEDFLERSKVTEPFGYILSPINERELNMAIEITLYKHGMDRKMREDNEKSRRILEKAFFDLTDTICRTLEYRDAYTAGHQRRVGKLATMVGQWMRLNQDDVNELYIGGLLHDIGKIGIPAEILNKTSPLTETEFTLIKAHSEVGFNIINGAKLPWNIKDIVLNHHEKLDGSGYPNGLSGSQISRNVRIITVCDVVEAMSTLRPYRAARTKEEVVEELTAGRKIKYDSHVVDIMMELMDANIFNPWDMK